MRQGRMERLAREFQQEIARIIQREIRDPRLGFVTVTRVKLSPDGSHAKVFYSSLGTPQQQQQGDQAALERSAAYIYSLIKKRFRLKVIPALTFEYDPSIAGSIAVDGALDHLREQPQE